MKVLKLIRGYIALAGFFIFVDQSGIGFKKNVDAVKKWAAGETEKLRFVEYWKQQAKLKENTEQPYESGSEE